VHNVTRLNVANVMETIRRGSPTVLKLIESGSVQLVGGIYRLDCGLVEFIDQTETSRPVPSTASQ
jgi:carbonic anhydrase